MYALELFVYSFVILLHAVPDASLQAHAAARKARGHSSASALLESVASAAFPTKKLKLGADNRVDAQFAEQVLGAIVQALRHPNLLLPEVLNVGALRLQPWTLKDAHFSATSLWRFINEQQRGKRYSWKKKHPRYIAFKDDVISLLSHPLLLDRMVDVLTRVQLEFSAGGLEQISDNAAYLHVEAAPRRPGPKPNTPSSGQHKLAATAGHAVQERVAELEAQVAAQQALLLAASARAEAAEARAAVLTPQGLEAAAEALNSAVDRVVRKAEATADSSELLYPPDALRERTADERKIITRANRVWLCSAEVLRDAMAQVPTLVGLLGDAMVTERMSG